MPVAELQAAPPEAATPPRSEQRLFDSGGMSLEDAILETWEELTRRGRAACPVCGGELRAAEGCRDCGAELA